MHTTNPLKQQGKQENSQKKKSAYQTHFLIHLQPTQAVELLLQPLYLSVCVIVVTTGRLIVFVVAVVVRVFGWYAAVAITVLCFLVACFLALVIAAAVVVIIFIIIIVAIVTGIIILFLILALF